MFRNQLLKTQPRLTKGGSQHNNKNCFGRRAWSWCTISPNQWRSQEWLSQLETSITLSLAVKREQSTQPVVMEGEVQHFVLIKHCVPVLVRDSQVCVESVQCLFLLDQWCLYCSCDQQRCCPTLGICATACYTGTVTPGSLGTWWGAMTTLRLTLFTFSSHVPEEEMTGP